MTEERKTELPLKGKTYTLYGEELSTDPYYEKIRNLADKYLNSFKDENELLEFTRSLSRRKSLLKRITKKDNGLQSRLINNLGDELSVYTKEVENHLQNLSLYEKFEKVISTTEEQYHLYMLEAELVNRIYANEFRRCEYKIALLPHCLRDLSRTCMSKEDEIDYFCKGCSKHCNVNKASTILKSAEINPYIWRNAELKKLFGILMGKYKSVGVLGIACIPELVRGMRLCMKHQVPVVGIPLDANRCARWMGEFHDNTVNLEALEKLVLG